MGVRVDVSEVLKFLGKLKKNNLGGGGRVAFGGCGGGGRVGGGGGQGGCERRIKVFVKIQKKMRGGGGGSGGQVGDGLVGGGSGWMCMKN